MAVTDIFQKQIPLPLVGVASVGVVIVAGVAIYLLTRRKKTVSLRF